MKAFQCLTLIFALTMFNCYNKVAQNEGLFYETDCFADAQYITVLGVAQDAGFPQINCNKNCCKAIYKGNASKKLVSCLGLVDNTTCEKWLFDATPNIKEQTQILKENHLDNGVLIDGIFLTHAHMGHYTGLMQLGREALGAKNTPVYAMPKMTSFLKSNGPWSQLVALNNIELRPLHHNLSVDLNDNLKVTPIRVPHRDEFSETVGYRIEGVHKAALYIPDIDKWQRWDKDIIREVDRVDYAFLDASFFKDGELDRDMTQIPHPFITETTTLFEAEPLETKNKIYFIHFNHTNPALKYTHRLKDSIQELGFKFANEGDNFQL